MHTRQIRRFRRSLRRFERLTHHRVKNCCAGVTLAQCVVLLEIDERTEPTMGQLASGLRLDNSTLTRTVDGLVARGLAVRAPDDRDRRAVRIRLTPEGESACRSIHQENDEWCRDAFRRIEPSERAAVLRNFEILVEAFLDGEAESRPVACGKSTAPRSTKAGSRRSVPTSSHGKEKPK